MHDDFGHYHYFGDDSNEDYHGYDSNEDYHGYSAYNNSVRSPSDYSDLLCALGDGIMEDDYSDDKGYDDDDDESKNKVLRTDSSHTSSVLSFLHDCYETKLHCDVVVTIGDKIFKTHRFVLAMISEYFRTLLQKEDGSKDGFTLLEELVKSKSFECILQFTYTGKVDFSNSDVETVHNLAIACDYLGVTTLKGFCEEYLATIVTTETVLGLFVCSYMYNMSYLYDVTKSLFMREFLVLSGTDEYFDLPVQLLQKFFEDKRLAIYKRGCLVPPMPKEREKLIFVGVLRYADKHILGNSVSSKELAKLLKCVKLLEFDVEYLNKEISNFPHLKENDNIQEVLEIVKSFNSSDSSKADTIPEFWMASREIAHRFIYSLSCVSHQSVEDLRWFCINEDELKPSSVLTKISLWIRLYLGRPLLGALEFSNSEGDVAFAGDRDDSMERHEIELQKGEVITNVFARSNWLSIDYLKFHTNFGNIYGPYGSDGGFTRRCTPKTKYMNYLHSFKGASKKTMYIATLSFRWITFNDRSMNVEMN